jgi:uncharacterized membrane protein
MSTLTSFWVWEQAPTNFLKMPLTNLFGWFVTGMVILGAFELRGLKMPEKWKRDQFPLKFYAVNLMLPMGFSIAAQLWLPVVATMLLFLICVWISSQTGGIHNFGKSQFE